MSSPSDHIPLKPRMYEILLALLQGDSHGYALIQQLTESSGARVLPGSFYRDLEAMETAGMIEETDAPPGTAGKKRCFRITEFGREVTRAETERMERLSATGARLLQEPRTGA